MPVVIFTMPARRSKRSQRPRLGLAGTAPAFACLPLPDADLARCERAGVVL